MHHFHDFLCLTFQLKGTLIILLEPTKNLQTKEKLLHHFKSTKSELQKCTTKRSSFGEHEHTKEKTKTLTLGLPSQLEGLKVARRRSKSPLSQGLHERPEDPSPWPVQSTLPAFTGTAGEDAPTELSITSLY